MRREVPEPVCRRRRQMRRGAQACSPRRGECCV